MRIRSDSVEFISDDPEDMMFLDNLQYSFKKKVDFPAMGSFRPMQCYRSDDYRKMLIMEMF
jgi:hypothetical protein